ncbi:MAG: nucleoside triphosphate pyrophosphohydrolase [Proteobacteria bacterium]|nr:nucleoside triphosphate pyrophosphohydrolase [Pseudomonadota bacterium]
MQAFDELIEICRKLREPTKGCPWHHEQTIPSLAPHTLSESYELIDAIEANDMPNLKEELGDLLFHIVLYAQHAAEAGQFSIEDVVAEVNEKIKRRKPYVFDEAVTEAPTLTTLRENKVWDKIKKAEKEAKGEKRESILDATPRSMPALAAAHDIQKRAIRAGFTWDTIENFYKKIDEELAEVKEAIASGDQEHITEEVGDMLFVSAILGWYGNTNPELALRQANAKFARRFKYVEKHMKAEGLDMDYKNMARMDELWLDAKKLEKAGKLEDTAKSA